MAKDLAEDDPKRDEIFSNVPIDRAGKFSIVGADQRKKATSFGRGTGSIYPWQNATTGKAYWVVRWQEDGKRKAKYFERTPEGHRQAEAFVRDRKAVKAVDRGGNQSVGDFLPTWLNTVKGSVRPTTFKIYERYAGFAIEHLPPTTVRGLRENDIQMMIDAAKNEMGPRSVRHVRDVLRNALSYAVMRGWADRNVAADSHAFRFPLLKSNVPDLWTDEQQRQFLAAIKGHPLPGREALFTVAYWQGMREGEILGLQWRYIDFQRHTLTVAWALAEGELVEPKTEKSRRTIELHPDAEAMLLELKKTWKQPALAKWRDLVFVTNNGTPLTPRNLIRDFKRVIERAGLPDLRFHDFRSMVSANLLKAGTDPKSVSLHLGHAQTSTTMNIYARIGSGDVRAAVREGWKKRGS